MERNAHVDFRRVNAVAQAHAVEFCQQYLPGGDLPAFFGPVNS